ncbi:hypothetical protein HQ520_02450, partial [bacterium]|nr:hypothetical protein [bacterium]
MTERPVVNSWVVLLAAILTVVLFLAIPPNPALAQDGPDVTLLTETEDFEFPNGWMGESGRHSLGEGYLAVKPQGKGHPVEDAMTMVELPESGVYHIWTRAVDYATIRPGTRLYQVWIDREMSPEMAGKHGIQGFAWEMVETRRLDAGPHMIGLYD